MATKDKLINLEDLKVLSDHVEGEVTDLKSDINVLANEGTYAVDLTWEHGGIDNATGELNNEGSTVRSRVSTFMECADYSSVSSTDESQFLWVIYYDANYNFKLASQIRNGTLNLYNEYSYFRLDYRQGLDYTNNIKLYKYAEFEKALVELENKSAEVNDLKSELNAEKYGNLYAPTSYEVIDSSGTVKTGNKRYITVNDDGSLTMSNSVSSSGQRLLRATDTKNILRVGKYTMQARFVLPQGLTDGTKTVYLRLGLSQSPKLISLKTELGGSTELTTQTVGWATATFELTQEERFCFEAFPNTMGAAISSQNPVTVDNLKIVYSSDVIDGLQDSVSNLEVSNQFAIVLPNGAHYYRDNIKSDKLKFPGSKMYVIANGARTAINYSAIVSQIPNYAEVTNGELVVTLPTTAAFGYDLDNNAFKMYTTAEYKPTASFVVLASRYYDIIYGTLIDKMDINGNNVSSVNLKSFVYTTSIARHSFEAYGNNGGMTLHVGSVLNTRLVNKQYGRDSVTLQWADISSDISQYITIDGVKADIILPQYSNALVYNVADGLLHIRNLTQAETVSFYDVTLFAISYGYPTSGILYDEYINRSVLDLVNSGGVDTAELRSQTFNAAYHSGATDFATKCQEFSSLLLGDTVNGVTAPTDFESFLFFTDPHLLEGENSSWEQRCYEFMAQIQKYYNSTPTTFCMCGGDWLGNSDLPNQACFKMGYINGFMESMFDDSYLIVGNHDTNCQGKKDSESATYTTKLSVQSIVDLWYRKQKKAYYKFNGANTTFYCFDTGTGAQALATDNNYYMTQAEWFAESLLTDNSDHIALAMHIIYYSYNTEDLTQGIHPLTLLLSQISSAYNSRGSITVNGTVYNYASSTGKVEFMLGGHYHQDKNGVMNDIPWFMTTNVRHDETLGASFDLVFANYDDREVKLIRVGSGDNRTISLT